MLRTILAAGAVVATLATAPAMAQQSQPPATEADLVLVGLPIYSSDGEKLGQVTQVGTAAGQRAVQAQIGGFLNVETSTVVIPDHVFQQKPDRIELSMTATEVGETISKQNRSSSKGNSNGTKTCRYRPCATLSERSDRDEADHCPRRSDFEPI